MTILWLDTDGMSHYHHMVRHEIYLLYINSPCLKQLNSDVPLSMGSIMEILVCHFALATYKIAPLFVHD